jgi:RNA polymerase sigma factor (TIGR02999 family)
LDTPPEPTERAAPASAALIAAAYEQLKQIARVSGARPGDTLNTTALVHEAYLKICQHPLAASSAGEHLKSLAARAMRQVLIDQARRASADKRGGGATAVSLENIDIAAPASTVDLLALEQALNSIERLCPRLARITEMHVFCGIAFAEIAEALGLTERTVLRDWRKARVLLVEFLDLPLYG